MYILLSYFPAPQSIMSDLSKSISHSSTDSTSIRPSVSSHSDNTSVSVSLTPTPALSMTTRSSALTEVSSQDGVFSSSFSSNASSLMGESITLFALISGFSLEQWTRKVTSKAHWILKGWELIWKHRKLNGWEAGYGIVIYTLCN